MEVSTANSIKVYNLSSGKSVPEWLNERKRRQLLKKNPDMQRRIQLLQDFDMPVSSSQVNVSPDGNFIIATGVYKPCVKCYDVNELSLKFERGLDSEVLKFCILSEDYSKLAFLQTDRYVELHVKSGTYFRVRVPRFGRDIAYHPPSCELHVVGASPEVYRLNLELGRFMSPLLTQSSSNNVCTFNPDHFLLAVGNQDGVVECWDPRSKVRAGSLHLTDSFYEFGSGPSFKPGVTALEYDGALSLGVGTSSGQVLLYDIRSTKPLIIKDHNYELPIKDIAFHKDMNLVLSADSKCLKLWHRDNAAPYVSIEPANDVTNLCYLPNSGLVLMACLDAKMLAYYIPSIGKAPKWCYFLDNLTEELEEDTTPSVYDDYKFVTDQELNTLGLSHLKGTNLLRAYMHGYFINIRLYKRAKSITEPFAYSEYRKKKIEERLEKDRATRIKQKKLPRINKQFALELLQSKKNRRNESVDTSNPLGDDRFAAMFQQQDFEMNPDSEEYQLLHPIISSFQKNMKRKLEKLKLKNREESTNGNVDSEREGEVSEDSSLEDYLIQSSESDNEVEEIEKSVDLPKYKEGRDIEFVQKHKITKETLEARLKNLPDEPLPTEFNEMADIRFSLQTPNPEPQIRNKSEKMRERKGLRRPAKSYLPKINRVDWKRKKR
ncbi:Nucleolar protein 10 [Oopsacas minuta]|uniref:Nucleolar protein 10 n=1 Tax=Oopsacas minuta TaxID=111878 RepID=A0AAV7K717_9METZ|nr:Nucleolar protein 10 [Oopsacas minuta]